MKHELAQQVDELGRGDQRSWGVALAIAIGPGIVEMCVVLLFESGRSHPNIGPGTKGVHCTVLQLYLYSKYTVVCCIKDTVYRVQHTGHIHDTGYTDNL